MQSIIALSIALSIALFATITSADVLIGFQNFETGVSVTANFPLKKRRSIIDAFFHTNLNKNGRFKAHIFGFQGDSTDLECNLTITESGTIYVINSSQQATFLNQLQGPLDISSGIVKCDSSESYWK
ncbi:unnamed protein product [Diplocarpon coronariae]